MFISLPTGSGKSLCYGSLPFVFDHLRKNGEKVIAIVVVISPLRPLMLDQAHSFLQKESSLCTSPMVKLETGD